MTGMGNERDGSRPDDGVSCGSIGVHAAPAVLKAIDGLGRTEDICFSPSGTRLAIAGFECDVVYVLDVDVDVEVDDGMAAGVGAVAGAAVGDGASVGASAARAVTVTGVTTLRCSSLHEPHGVTFLTEDTIAVANRHAEVPILAMPARAVGLRTVEVTPLQTLRADEVDGLKSPGSVVAVEIASDIFELLVCNNYADNVSRHVLDARDDFRVLGSEVLLRRGLEIPDGATLSADRSWLAVSNHNTHSVWMYRFDETLGPDSLPDGVLENVHYPHGLRFAADDTVLIVADAGAPYLTAFARGAADWTGVRQPTTTVRIMEDEAYLRGRYNVQEGGPKGLAVYPSGSIVVVTSEHQPLRFLDSRALVGDCASAATSVAGRRSAVLPEVTRPSAVPSEAARLSALRSEATRVALLRSFRAASRLADDVAQLEREFADRDRAVSDAGNQIAAMAGRVEALEAEAAVAAANRAESDDELRRTRAEVEHLGAALAEGAARCAVELAELRESLAYERSVVADREARLAAVRASNSWRLTAPLRALSGRRSR